MADESSIFSRLPVASFTPEGGTRITFSITGAIRERNPNRLVRQKRPYRRGAKLDSTGEGEREWSFTAHFNNRLLEEGVETTEAPYPNMLRRLLAAFKLQSTGTLVLPTTGAVRVRIEQADRTDDTAQTDVGELAVTAVEDNEESLSTQSFLQPSVRASVVRLSEQTTFSRQRAGGLDTDAKSITEFASELESLLLAPGRSVSDLQSKVTAARRALGRVVSAEQSLARSLGLETDEPRGSEFWRNMARLQDLEAKSADEKFASRPRVKAFVIDVEQTSMFEIAARFKQDAGELLDLNSERPVDPFLLTRGEVIRVFESAPA